MLDTGKTKNGSIDMGVEIDMEFQLKYSRLVGEGLNLLSRFFFLFTACQPMSQHLILSTTNLLNSTYYRENSFVMVDSNF